MPFSLGENGANSFGSAVDLPETWSSSRRAPVAGWSGCAEMDGGAARSGDFEENGSIPRRWPVVRRKGKRRHRPFYEIDGREGIGL